MRSAHLTLAAAGLLAAALAALLFALDPFDHGIWLVAYLFLVGFGAQLLLGRGQAALVAARGAPRPQLGVQASLWNAGVLLVPVGVLAGARLPVVTGGIALVAALIGFAQSAAHTRPLAGEPSRRWLAQVALIVFMMLSVFVGVALGWDKPWI